MLNTDQRQLISIVVPAYNEQAVLPQFHQAITRVLSELPFSFEIVYINDGSTDDTLRIIKELRESDNKVTLIDLSRNFGKEIALTAGLQNAIGDAVVVIDADLQDPPELIPELINEWQNGYDVVYAQRTHRKGESLVKRTTAHFFYRIIQRISKIAIPEDTGD